MTKAAHVAIMAEKSKQVALLQDEVAYLRRLLSPPKHIHNVSLEADAVLEGRQDQIILPAPAAEAVSAAQSEAARLLSGNY